MTDTTLDEKDARIHELEEQLRLKHEIYLQPFGLTQQQGKLLALLMEVPVASAETIRLRVDMNTEAKVAVHRLRSRLKPHDINNAKRFHGFWLSPDDKAKVKVVVE
jgi:hypothetical protein